MPVDRELALPGSSARLRDFARRHGLSGFWAWWLKELSGLVPARPRAAMQRRRMRAVLAFEGDRATLWQPVLRDGRLSMVETASIGLSGEAARHSRNGRRAPRALPSRDLSLSYRFRRVRRSARRSSCPRRWRTICARRSPTISIGIRRSSRTRFISTPRSSIAISGAARFASRWWRRGAHRSMRPSNTRSRSARRLSPSFRTRPIRRQRHDSTCCRMKCGRTACGGSAGTAPRHWLPAGSR